MTCLSLGNQPGRITAYGRPESIETELDAVELERKERTRCRRAAGYGRVVRLREELARVAHRDVQGQCELVSPIYQRFCEQSIDDQPVHVIGKTNGGGWHHQAMGHVSIARFTPVFKLKVTKTHLEGGLPEGAVPDVRSVARVASVRRRERRDRKVHHERQADGRDRVARDLE